LISQRYIQCGNINLPQVSSIIRICGNEVILMQLLTLIFVSKTIVYIKLYQGKMYENYLQIGK